MRKTKYSARHMMGGPCACISDIQQDPILMGRIKLAWALVLPIFEVIYDSVDIAGSVSGIGMCPANQDLFIALCFFLVLGFLSFCVGLVFLIGAFVSPAFEESARVNKVSSFFFMLNLVILVLPKSCLSLYANTKYGTALHMQWFNIGYGVIGIMSFLFEYDDAKKEFSPWFSEKFGKAVYAIHTVCFIMLGASIIVMFYLGFSPCFNNLAYSCNGIAQGSNDRYILFDSCFNCNGKS